MIVAATFDLESPHDAGGLDAALAAIGPARIAKLAVFAKVAGDYDDGARERSRAALERCLGARSLQDRSRILVAVGCEGVATPFGYALAETDGPAGGEPRLAMGFATSSEPPPDDELDRPALASRVAATVRAAARDAALAPADVVMAFVKVPAPQASRPGGEKVRGRRARGLAALGAGIALGDIAAEAVTDAAVAADASLYCSRVQPFAGPEVTRVEAIVLGNRPGAGGDLVARAAVLDDLIDVRSVKRVLLAAGLAVDADGELATPERVAACFVKAGVADDGRVRGATTTIHASAITPERHMRAALSGAFGVLLGTTRVFVTGDPVHAAPPGGGVACVLVRAPAPR
jgi:cyanuric acid amidohydrolase